MRGLPIEGRDPWLAAAEIMAAEVGVTVVRWRKATVGLAHTRSSDLGIEAPKPTTPLRFAVFAHEVGHQALHSRLGRLSNPRWLEEIEAWEFALDSFERFALYRPPRVVEMAVERLDYTFRKAVRRGKRLQNRVVPKLPSWYPVGRLASIAADPMWFPVEAFQAPST